MLWYDELYLMLLDSAIEFVKFDRNLAGEMVKRQQKRALWWKMVCSLSLQSAEERQVFLGSAKQKLGLPDDWESRYRNSPQHYRRFYTLTASELQQLSDSGMAIGAHTLSHPVLSQQPTELARKEIAECGDVLEKTLGVKSWAFAYPFGDPASVTTRELEMAEQADYECAFLNYGRRLTAETPRFAIPRVHVTADMTMGEFEAHIAGFHAAMKTWLAISR
jgi:peptidoglycan/xylan/chitin deacetylase (PgdA/CDA1 family)